MKHLHVAYTMLIAVNSSELQTILPTKLINYEMPNLNLNNRRKKLQESDEAENTSLIAIYDWNCKRLPSMRTNNHKNVEVCSSKSSLLRFLLCESIVRRCSCLCDSVVYYWNALARWATGKQIEETTKRKISIMSFSVPTQSETLSGNCSSTVSPIVRRKLWEISGTWADRSGS